MKTSKKGIDLIIQFEGLRLKPYLCSAKVPTIGVGSTRYENGTKVTMKDPQITHDRAIELFKNTLIAYEKGVDKGVKSVINQNQYDALVSFCYNVGVGNLYKSSLLRKVNLNPNDPSIKNEFLKWNKAGGKIINGLTKRRERESVLYFS